MPMLICFIAMIFDLGVNNFFTVVHVAQKVMPGMKASAVELSEFTTRHKALITAATATIGGAVTLAVFITARFKDHDKKLAKQALQQERRILDFAFHGDYKNLRAARKKARKAEEAKAAQAAQAAKRCRRHMRRRAQLLAPLSIKSISAAMGLRLPRGAGLAGHERVHVSVLVQDLAGGLAGTVARLGLDPDQQRSVLIR